MKFCVVGLGFVGKAVYEVLDERHVMHIIDPLRMIPTADYYATVEAIPVDDIDGFIICVPTPQADNGRCDDTLVQEYVRDIQQHQPHAQILIKSTTSVETLASFNGNVTFSPEFLRGSTGADPSKEFRESTFAIYGGTGGRWWHDVFSQLMTTTDVRFLDIESAGFLKYAENSFLATKVMFFNELETLYSQTININFDAMVEALALDKRVGMSHTQVPGPDGKYGFGGHCLPKDTSEFAGWAEAEESPLQLLDLVRELNDEYRDV